MDQFTGMPMDLLAHITMEFIGMIMDLLMHITMEFTGALMDLLVDHTVDLLTAMLEDLLMDLTCAPGRPLLTTGKGQHGARYCAFLSSVCI